MASIQAQLKMALQLHQRGDFQGAEAHYSQVLSVEPNNYTALVNVATIYLSKGEWQRAERSLKWASLTNGANPEIFYKLGFSLQQQGKLDEAIVAYQKVLKQQENYSAAYSQLGMIYHQQGKFEEAIAAFRKCIALEPNSADGYYNLGYTLQSSDQFEESIPYYLQALKLQPQHSSAQMNLAIAFRKHGKLPEALNSFQTALTLQPNDASLHYNYALTLYEAGQIKEAVSAYQKAISLKPDYPEAYFDLINIYLKEHSSEHAINSLNQADALKAYLPEMYYNLGFAFQCLDKLDEAVFCYQQVVKIHQQHFPTYTNLAICLKRQEKFVESIAAFQKALAIKPSSSDMNVLHEVFYNYGLTLYSNGQIEEAISAYKEAIKLKEDYPEARLSLGLALLLIGNYPEGWPEYEFRLSDMEKYKIPNLTKWNGTLNDAPELILLGEQGIGDVIQFLRYGKLLKKSFPVVSIAVDKSLCNLVERTKIFDQVYSFPVLPSSYNPNAKWIFVLSLPGLLDISYQNPILTEPYMIAEAKQSEFWYSKFQATSSLVVGLNWQGNPKVEECNDFKGRSFKLSEYELLASIPGIQFVSLQKGYGSEQLETCTFKDKFVDCQDEISAAWDWLETAAIINSCDLIITSDTSVAHLAGALGKPTWILLKKIPEWRWGLEGETSPWYPSVRLLRQTEAENWMHVMHKVKEELQNC